MNIRAAFLAALVTIVSFGGCGNQSSLQLPVALGQSIDSVRKAIGTPTESVPLTPKSPEVIQEWYYSSGIVVDIADGKIAAITLHPHASFRGFLPYGGKIINDLTLADSRESFIQKLGAPIKTEIEKGYKDPNENAPAAVWPAMQTLYWRHEGMVVEVRFLLEAQSVNREEKTIRPEGAIDYLKLYR